MGRGRLGTTTAWREGVTHACALPGYGRSVDEARAVLERLRALLVEAEAWSRIEGGEAGECAVDGLRSALTRDMIVL